MTTDEALTLLDDIKALADIGDDERAHIEEDQLRAKVLRAIVELNSDDPLELARLALSTSDIDFQRWHA